MLEPICLHFFVQKFVSRWTKRMIHDCALSLCLRNKMCKGVDIEGMISIM